MSCEIRPIAQVLEVEKCKKLLLTKADEFGENWLQESLVSFSPTGELFVVARGTNLVVYTSKWDSTETETMKMKYSITWHGSPCFKSGNITSVLCLPLLSHGQSSSGTDWTCIVIGFSSGTVKFYTENMDQLLYDVFHAEPVLQVKCSFFKSSNYRRSSNVSDQESSESIYILYKSVMCVLNGFSLFQTLRGCRNRLARQSASLQAFGLDVSFPMDYKKYSFSEQDAITDASYLGQTSVNLFDHLVTASLVGGFKCNIKSSPPQTSLTIATGRKPFLGFHYTMEGGGNAILADVALAVASKIKESVTATLPGWFGFGSSEQEKVKVNQEQSEPLRCRFGLCDLWRHGNRIITSPDSKFSAITDSLGRIFLIENGTGIGRRLWKGYRDAQCGFLEVKEDLEKSEYRISKFQTSAVARCALFIVIYAPKKGLIEIFGVQQGPCVGSFKVSKQGLLLYTPYGLLGFNGLSSNRMLGSQYPVIFISEEGIMEIAVPFHCGLRSDNSFKARDLHVLKKMKIYLKEEHSDTLKFNDDMKAFALDLKTEEIKLQAIEIMMTYKQINENAIMTVLNVFKESSCVEDGKETSRNLVEFVESLEKLLAFFAFLKDLNEKPPNYKAVVNVDENNTYLEEILILSKKEISSVFSVINSVKEMERKRNDTTPKVSFNKKNNDSLYQFLLCFDFVPFNSNVHEGREVSWQFKNNLISEKMAWLGEFLFNGVFYSEEWLNDWKTYLNESKIDKIGLLKCLLSYWLNKNIVGCLTYEISSLLELIQAICSLVDPEDIAKEHYTLSPWWETIRNYLKTSQCTIGALLAAIACRAVTIRIEQIKEMKQAQSGKSEIPEIVPKDFLPTQNSDWENVSKDTWEWDILIMNLEDIALLNTVLNMIVKNFQSNRPKLDFHMKELSLNKILEKGDGYVSELVAKWLTQFGIEPCSLIDATDVEFLSNRSSFDKESENDSIKKNNLEIEEANIIKESENIHVILGYIHLLKEKFPYSLTCSSLLANLCWEYMMFWYRNPDDLNYLEASTDYLRNIPSKDLQNGLSYLCWSTYIIQKFMAVAKLINQFGKVPRDKFCSQEVNFISIQVPAFLKICTELLNIMLETETSEKRQFVGNQEGLWQNWPIGNTPSLVNLAISQPPLNEELLVLHYQLSLSLYMVAELNIKTPKLFSCLFDNVALTEFFTDLAKNSLSNHSSNVILTNSRKQFLYKVIAGAVQTIEVVESVLPFPVTESTDYVPETRISAEKATKWISYCFDLARMWDVPLDDLRRQHVCELYSCGFDRLAEEILPAVNESSLLASQLLVIAGMRLKTYIHGSSGLSKKFSRLGPNLSTWLECLNSENLKCHQINLNDLCTMVSYILKSRPATADEESLALAMAESIPSLENDSL